MSGKATSIRNSAKAIIIEDTKILTIRMQDSVGSWYLLPGGGQEPTETLEEALVRECLEEIGVGIEIGPLRFIREYFSCNHEFADESNDAHQIELMFLCKIKPGETPSVGHLPDASQNGIEWINLEDIDQYRLYPLTMRKYFKDIDNSSIPIYFGDIN